MACDPFLDGCISRTPPSKSCQSAARGMELVLKTSVEALGPFFCEGQGCDGISGLVTYGPPVVDVCNIVAVWSEGFTYRGVPATSGGMLMGMPGLITASMGVQLWLDAYPVGHEDGGQFIPPALGLIHEASLLMSVIGETWYAHLANMASANPGELCNSWSIDPMEPLEPQGGCVGWETGLKMVLG